ncbi:Ig-like domain-containing protein [Azonexus sp.]|jgi:RHS repeat-associated protein|uniref:Ig-like domain-containing protein n=1 Tax=Azonexus sp. TaxID=1872668 RepID=UPI00282C26FA|nr:Ig-like domain-containing protein [Azonexus sp.]MDR1995308.1 hypothetical protein [Azonexus sp.]
MSGDNNMTQHLPILRRLIGLLALGLALTTQANAQTNAPPTVSITKPVTGATYTAPANMTLVADAAASDGGNISKVEFYNGATRIGTGTAAPYLIAWNNVAAGTYTVTAKAYDDQNATTVSSAVIITVSQNQNAPPTVSITKPATGANYTAPANMTLVADAAASDGGSISKVEFYNGATRIGTGTAAPYLIAWNNVAAGAYTVTAKAYDDRNATTTSAPIHITVGTPPTVSLTAPAANTQHQTGSNLVLSANAADSDGTIAQVAFYQNGTLIGTAPQAPYTVTWNNLPAGSHTLTAIATDNHGLTTTSAPVSITVGSNAQTTQIYYLHSDHLDTPRLVTDEQGKIVWRNGPLTEPFGNSPVEEDPDGDGILFTLNLRFPGQYFDRETNTHYNYFRDYDPLTGRYLQSDPIGLAGGINTYTYVGGNPVSRKDLQGLDWDEVNLPPLPIYCDPENPSSCGGQPTYQSARTRCNINCNIKYQFICTGASIGTAFLTKNVIASIAVGGGCFLVKAIVCDQASCCNAK